MLFIFLLSFQQKRPMFKIRIRIRIRMSIIGASTGVAKHSQSVVNGVKRFQWDPRGKYKHSEAQMSDGMHSTTEEMRRGGIFSSHRGEFFEDFASISL